MHLSICMPTYNYGAFIGEALDSILSQMTDGVEVIVLDGASTDDTKTVVNSRVAVDSRLKYYQQSHRGGIDRDIEKVVSFASGRYCWLFSADDVMLPNAIEKVIQATKSGLDIYVCEHALCDMDMNIISRYPVFKPSVGKRVFDFGDARQREEYFRVARNSEAFFSFLAGPIFKKEIWDDAVIPDSFRGTCWIVAAHLLSAFSKAIRVCTMAETLLHKREGNDSFSNGSLVNRCKIAIENYHFIVNSLFGYSSYEAKTIRRILQRDVSFRVLISAKLKASRFPAVEDQDLLLRLVRMHYSDSGLLGKMKIFIYEAMPIAFLETASWAVRRARRCIK